MGQQQLLYILLAIVIVGLGIALMVSLFRQNAVDSKRDILINECINLATKAMEYYKRPVNFGGGNKSFSGWEIPDALKVSENGSFTSVVTSGSVEIIGTGNEIVTGTDSIKVRITVTPSEYTTTILK